MAGSFPHTRHGRSFQEHRNRPGCLHLLFLKSKRFCSWILFHPPSLSFPLEGSSALRSLLIAMPLTTARRISYVIPPPHSSPPYLSLPSPTHPRNGSPHPIILPLSESGVPASLPSSSSFPSLTSDTVSHPQHHLGISALAIDTSTQLSGKDSPEGILYTGGRDGLVASWELGAKMRKKRPDGGNEEKVRWNEIVDDDWEDDEEDSVNYPLIVGNSDEVDEEIRWKRMPWEDRWEADVNESGSTKPPEATFRQCMQYHTDWVNDILLCNLNQTLISASSDRTIRAWSPHTSTPDHQQAPTIIGTHTDYVHSLTHSKHNAWVASGGFDRQIKIWDISQGSSHTSTSFTPGAAKAPEPIVVLGRGEGGEEQIMSVYSLETNPSGGLVVSGGPDGIVRMWDPRTGARQIGQLMGHTENVRALRLSEDGRFLLSGSSDTTVKLWSISSQRVIHTFTHHSASITALFTSHPNLERFYTGDLSGNVSVVDLQRCSSIADGECVSLLQEGNPAKTSPSTSKDEKERNPLANRGSVAINKIVALDDQYVWTATASSTVNMWKDVGRRIRRNPAFRSADDSDDQSSSAHSSADGVLVGHHEQDEEEESWEASKEQGEQLLANEFKMPTRTFTPPGSEKNSPRNSWHTGSIGLNAPSPASPSQLLTAESSSSLSTKTSILKPSQVRTFSGITIKPGSSVSPSIEPSSSGFSTIFGRQILQTQPEEPEPNKLICDGVSYDSLVNLAPLNDPYEFLSPHYHQANSDQIRRFSTASILSLPAQAKPQPIPSAIATENSAKSPSSNARGDPPSNRPTPTMQDPGLPVSDVDATPERGTGARFDLPLSRDAEREAKSKFFQRELLIDATCFNRNGPSGAIHGKHGLVRSLMFNDRQHVVTCDTAGVIAVWNIVFGQCIGLVDSSVVVDAYKSMSTSSKLITPRDALELVKERMEGEAVVPTWCSVDTKIGGLTVSLERGRCFDAEIHLDELKPRGLQGEFKDDQRVSLGKLLLANLFEGFIKAELSRHQHSSDDNKPELTNQNTRNHPTYIPLGTKVMSMQTSSQPSTPGGMGAMSALATPAMTAALAPTDDFFSSTLKKDYFSKITSPASGHQSLEIPTAMSPSMDIPTSPGIAQTPGGSFMGKFKGFGKNKKSVAGATPAHPVAEISEEESQRLQDEAKYGKLAPMDMEQKRLLDQLFSNPLNPPKPTEVPPIPSLSDMAIVIDEESKDAGAWAVTYRGLVAHAPHEVDTLEMALPSWVLEYLLAGRIPAKEAVKLSFVLEPCKSKKGTMAEMPNGNNRLTADRALRIRKICAYILDRLGMGPPIPSQPSSSTTHDSSKAHAVPLSSASHSSTDLSVSDETPLDTQPVRPEDIVELICNGLSLPSDMTLAAVKHFVWRQAGDVVLSYRLKTRFEGAQFEEIRAKS